MPRDIINTEEFTFEAARDGNAFATAASLAMCREALFLIALD